MVTLWGHMQMTGTGDTLASLTPKDPSPHSVVLYECISFISQTPNTTAISLDFYKEQGS